MQNGDTLGTDTAACSQTSLNYVPGANQGKIMGLLSQFNNVLKFKNGQQQGKINRHVLGMFEWVMGDVTKEVSARQGRGLGDWRGGYVGLARAYGACCKTGS